LAVTPSAAEEANAGVAGDWLARYSTARIASVGGAYVSHASGAMGVLWNPAGLAHQLQNEAQFETVSLFEESRINGFSFALPSRSFPSVGITLLSMSSGEFQRTNELNDDLGTFSESNLAVMISGAKSITPRIALGTNIKLVRQNVEEFSGGGVGLDFGLLWTVAEHWRVGASVMNIGGPSVNLREVDENYATHLRGGLSWRATGGRAQVSAEVDQRAGAETFFRGGAEVWVHRKFALRAGYAEERVAAGLGFRFAHGFRVDYGVSDHELGLTHRIGFAYDFGGFFASSQAVPEVFSPTGEHSVTKFELKAKTPAEAAQWNLQILDKHDQVVRRFGGKGSPPAHVLWDGTDESGMPLPDGVYRYRLSVLDDEGVEIDARQQKVTISTAGPQGSVPVSVQ